MPPTDLERSVGRALQRLPAPRAPHTLLPRVLAAARQAEARRSARGWRSWPLRWQVAAGVLFAAAVAAGVILGPAVRTSLAGFWTVLSAGTLASVAGPVEGAAEITRRADTTLEVVRILWRMVLAPLMAYAAALFALMCLVCAGFELSLTWRSRKAHSS